MSCGNRSKDADHDKQVWRSEMSVGKPKSVVFDNHTASHAHQDYLSFAATLQEILRTQISTNPLLLNRGKTAQQSQIVTLPLRPGQTVRPCVSA